MISDVAELCDRLVDETGTKGNRLMKFELGEPFQPLQQLLSVQPAGSRNLLPKPLGDLMVTPGSKICLYYPEDFEEDFENVKYRYEAVAMVPFIDERILLEEYNRVVSQISPEEIVRNALTDDKLIYLDADN